MSGTAVFLDAGSLCNRVSALASGVALGGVGMLTSLFNGRGAWYSACRQWMFGSAAAAVTYGLGAALGASLSEEE